MNLGSKRRFRLSREAGQWTLTLAAITVMLALTAWLTPGLGDGHDQRQIVAAEQDQGREQAREQAREQEREQAQAQAREREQTQAQAQAQAQTAAPDERGAGDAVPAWAAGGPEDVEMGQAGREEAELAEEADAAAEGQFPSVWVLPVDNPAILRGYGYGFNPNTEDYRFHRGLDLSAAVNAPVRAVAAGQVLEAGADDYWGGVVRLEHAEGWVTIYKCLEPTVRPGQTLAAGDLLGRVITAPAEAVQEPHLHLEVEQNSASLDPAALM